ncbi:MAG: hypothetical protein ACK4XJ_08710 [Fimbriimonadaceae bacterium]
MKKSTKMAIGLAVTVGAAWFGWNFISDRLAFQQKFDAIEPGRVTLLGINRRSGYRIIVANQVAQLVKVSDTRFGAPTDRDESQSDDSGPKTRLPLRALMKTLQGDTEALSELITVLNEIRTDDIPPDPVIWTAEDVRKAIDGDSELMKKLEEDLNMKLDGTPLDYVRPSAIFDGIVLKLPVEVKIPQPDGTSKTMTGYVLENFKTRLHLNLYRELASELFDDAMIAGKYRNLARQVFENPSLKQNLAQTLAQQIDPKRLQEYARAPEIVIENTTVVINENQINSVSYREDQLPDGKPVYTLDLGFSNEGRLRLWQYSKPRVGSQLLLVVDGIAVAAPVIAHELASSSLQITGLRDTILVKDTVKVIEECLSERRGETSSS